jgi:hypothetical protein
MSETGPATGRRRSGRKAPDTDALVKDAREALALVRKARGAHNPPTAGALVRVAREKAEEGRVEIAGGSTEERTR